MEANLEKKSRLTILETFIKFKYGKGRRVARCLCSCGNETEVIVDNIRAGRTKSCGCMEIESRIKHGLSKHPLYGVMEGMYSRCYNPNNRKYVHYGARGIKICQEWLSNYGAFVTWGINNGWRKGLTCDRRNNDGNYEPDNCRFVTYAVQNSNRRNSKSRVQSHGGDITTGPTIQAEIHYSLFRF